MQCILDSLDRITDRRRDARAKKMCLEVVMDPDSTRPKPDGMPEWATELLDSGNCIILYDHVHTYVYFNFIIWLYSNSVCTL